MPGREMKPKKDDRLSLRINKELKEILLRHKVSPQHIFEQALISDLLNKRLTKKEKEAVLINQKRLERIISNAPSIPDSSEKL